MERQSEAILIIWIETFSLSMPCRFRHPLHGRLPSRGPVRVMSVFLRTLCSIVGMWEKPQVVSQRNGEIDGHPQG